MDINRQWNDMCVQNIEAMDRKELVDIATVNIKKDLPHNEKLLTFLEEIKNPYCFLCSDVSVKVCFTHNGPNLAQTLENYFICIKQG